MTTSLPTEKEFYLSATRVEMDGFDVLTVYKALRTKTTQSWTRPVLDVLTEQCYSWVSAQVHEDPEMMGRYAVELVYHVWHECPGHSVLHECETEPAQLIPAYWIA